MNIDLLTWIVTGELAGIVPGDHKDLVRRAWGDPAGWGSSADFALKVDDCMNADVWGHGLWTSYYEGASLDGVSCCVSARADLGWHFDMGAIDPLFFDSTDKVERILTRHAIDYFRLPKIFHVQNVKTGEVLERKRRLAAPVIIAGNAFATRITFDADGRTELISNPVSLRRQTLAFSRLDADPYVIYPAQTPDDRVR
ncbi:hypothetical protein [Massilia sp. CCM 8734]|uniref:hypothetical protein n=1 Tax=Massilia sp. CCM 8734 TaxID=2609283 RepID=UPI0014226085|nr:hypothetical protein [Massilia sp. CCM 8734]NHZ96081.1 hypothetical protein [Massilia sp. CCM 8734]